MKIKRLVPWPSGSEPGSPQVPGIGKLINAFMRLPLSPKKTCKRLRGSLSETVVEREFKKSAYTHSREHRGNIVIVLLWERVLSDSVLPLGFRGLVPWVLEAARDLELHKEKNKDSWARYTKTFFI